MKKVPGAAPGVGRVLITNGMDRDEARKAVVGALRGNAGNLDDVLKFLPKGEQYSALANATPERQKAIEQQRLEAEGRQNEAHNVQRLKDEDNARVKMLNEQGKQAQELAKHKQEREQTWDLQDRRELLTEKARLVKDNITKEMGDFVVRDATGKERGRYKSEVEATDAASKLKSTPFTGDYFDYTKKVQDAALTTKLSEAQLKKLGDLEVSLKKIDDTLKKKQREAARAG
jgi:hypothetical protein